MGRINESFGPNVTRILCGGTYVVRGRIPAQVRKEIAAAVKAGVLGRIKRNGLAPEVLYHPDHLHLAHDIHKQHALVDAERIRKCFAFEERADELSKATAT